MNYLSNLWSAMDFASLESTALRVAGALLCIILHEMCHGFAAYALGDPTAKRQHRLSLNPLHHIDWLGFVSMVITGVGWAKPVPVDMRYFKHPKQGMALTALAGPVSNLVLALLLILGDRLLANYLLATGQLPGTLFYFLRDTAILSIGLGVFNLLPIPPLDGSKILASFLPDRAYVWLMRYERFGFILVILLVSAGAASQYLNVAISTLFRLFCRVVGFEV